MSWDTQQFIEFGRHAAGIVIVVILALAAYYAVKRGLKGLLAKEYLTHPVYVVTKSAIRWLFIIVVAVISLQQIGVNISHIMGGLLTVAGMVGIIFIAVWSTLSNIFCALLLVIFRMFRIGDEIEVVEPVGGNGLKGRVKDFNVMFTSLVEPVGEAGEEVVTQVPNNIFFQKPLRRRPGQRTENLGQRLLSKPLPLNRKRKQQEEGSKGAA